MNLPKKSPLSPPSPTLSALALAVALLLGLTSNARAQSFADPPSAAAVRPSSIETRWYGYEPALTDGVALGLMVGALATWHFCLSFSDEPPAPECSNTASNQFVAASGATYLFAPPLIHALNGHWDKAGLSLGLRGAPLLLAWGASAAQDNRGSSSISAALVVGGTFAAMIIDDAWLSRDTVPKPSVAWYAAPAFDPKNRSASLTAGGTF